MIRISRSFSRRSSFPSRSSLLLSSPRPRLSRTSSLTVLLNFFRKIPHLRSALIQIPIRQLFQEWESCIWKSWLTGCGVSFLWMWMFPNRRWPTKRPLPRRWNTKTNISSRVVGAASTVMSSSRWSRKRQARALSLLIKLLGARFPGNLFPLCKRAL